jgi:uncharacterized membrane protein YeaQ/YmgE (transglycosylase-associated protein family)
VTIVSWIVLGALIGIAAHAVLGARFPGGVMGTLGAGAVGAFLGGAIFTLLAGRGVGGVDGPSLAIAVVGSVGLLAVVRKAGHAEPPHP